MVKIYYDKDVNAKILKEKIIGVIGFGSQGHAHAQNLRDSGFNVIVSEAKGTEGWRLAEKVGFKPKDASVVAKTAEIIMMLVPDQLQAKIYKTSVEAGLTRGKMLMFAHGFNIHYSQILPPPDVDVTMIAPKCPGHMLRQLYTEQSGAPALIAVHQNKSGKARELALAYAYGIGCTRAGVLETSFQEETETDLFGEQTVLCGGVTSLIKAGFDTLIQAGYQPEIAYFECLHELKLIVDLIYNGGFKYMRYSVSDTAEYGDYTRGPRVINGMVKDTMVKILSEIRDGTFAREWILENQAGRPVYNALRRHESEHEIEIVGEKLRKMMPWLKTSQKK